MKINYSTIYLKIFFLLIVISFVFTGTSHSAQATADIWNYEGIAWHTYPTKVTGTTPVYRFWSANYRSHFYTISEAEKAKVIKGDTNWRYEGVAYYVNALPSKSNTPVYRFWSNNYRSHFYTISAAEKDKVIKGDKNWRYEGVAYYVSSSQQEQTKPAYRFWNDLYRSHFYTMSEVEKEKLESQGLGPSIKVGVHAYTRDDLRNAAFKIDANKDYVIKDKSGKKIAKISGGTTTSVKYDGDSNFRIYNSISDKIVSREVQFAAADGNNFDMIFDVHKPGSEYDNYRGELRLRHSEATRNTWVINKLPLEQYVWGIGEMTGTGDDDYDRLMTAAFRTYAYWKILYSTKYATEGFTVDATPGNQIYRGHIWEERYPDIRKAAQITRGKVAKHKSDVALSPFSSWTDGRTRSFEERWGSTLYPWAQSVKDSWGKHPDKSTSQLESEGNHMVGISAHGALSLAGDHDWNWDRIMKYYLTGINIEQIY